MPVELPPLAAEDVSESHAERFGQTGRSMATALEPLLGLTAGDPQRTMLLAHVPWDLTPPDAAATDETWRAALDRRHGGSRGGALSTHGE